MKIHIFTIITILLLSFVGFGQDIEATTKDGKAVILKPDKSWEYVAEKPVKKADPTQDSSKAVKTFEQLESEIGVLKDKENFFLKYDKFKDSTDFRVTADMLWKNKSITGAYVSTFNWSLISAYKGNGIFSKPENNYLCISSASSSWTFLRNHELILIIDSDKTQMGKGTHDGSIITRGVSEFMCWDLTPEQLSILTKANSLQFQLDRMEGEVRPEKMLLFKQYSDLLTVKQ